MGRVTLPTVRRIVTASVLASAGLFVLATASAQPQVPATYFGTATVNGLNTPDGTEVRAFVDGNDCTQPNAKGTFLEGGVSSDVIVVMHESQAEGCGTVGALVSFKVGGADAGQTAEWSAGVQKLNLNAGEGSPIALPTPTETATIGAATATAAAALLTPENGGPPPTDDPGVLAPAIGDPVFIEEEGSSSLVAWVAIILGVLALGGAVAGWALSRKRA